MSCSVCRFQFSFAAAHVFSFSSFPYLRTSNLLLLAFSIHTLALHFILFAFAGLINLSFLCHEHTFPYVVTPWAVFCATLRQEDSYMYIHNKVRTTAFGCADIPKKDVYVQKCKYSKTSHPSSTCV